MSTNNNGLTAGHSQPVKTLSKITTKFIADCAGVKRATSHFYINRGIGLDSIMLLILAVVLLIQGVLQ